MELELIAAGERPVFDVANDNATGGRDLDTRGKGEWSPPRQSTGKSDAIHMPEDGPSAEHWLKAGVAWYSSCRYSGQHANENQDWPLAKLLKTEGNDFAQRLADRYRALHEAAHAVTDLIGKDIADDIYLLHRTDIDPATGNLVDKGIKTATGRSATVGTAGTRSAKADPEKTKKRGKAMPKKWNGDLPLIHRIDASRELAKAQAALGPVRDAFEAAVVGNDTLETIGRDHGVGNPTGAKGAGRALVFLGFAHLDRHWRHERRQAA